MHDKDFEQIGYEIGKALQQRSEPPQIPAGVPLASSILINLDPVAEAIRAALENTNIETSEAFSGALMSLRESIGGIGEQIPKVDLTQLTKTLAELKVADYSPLLKLMIVALEQFNSEVKSNQQEIVKKLDSIDAALRAPRSITYDSQGRITSVINKAV